MPGKISPEIIRHTGISNYFGNICHCQACSEQSEETKVEAIPSKYSPAKWILSLVILTCLILTNSGYGQETKPELPKHKQTVLGLYVTAKEAYGKWRADPEKVKVLDVRTPEEYIFVGHAEMAWNIPLAFQTYNWDPTKKHFAIEPSPEFVSQVKEQFTVEDTLLVMCRSGGRSAMAVNLLAKAGFKNAFNIIEGMEGDMVRDPESLFNGKRMKNGWKNSGLPWTYKINTEKMKLPMESN